MIMKYAASSATSSGAANGIHQPSHERPLTNLAHGWISAIWRVLGRNEPSCRASDLAAPSCPPALQKARSVRITEPVSRIEEMALIAVVVLTIVLYFAMFIGLYRWTRQAPIFAPDTAEGIAAPLPWP
jgi:hypothetical protein